MEQPASQTSQKQGEESQNEAREEQPSSTYGTKEQEHEAAEQAKHEESTPQSSPPVAEKPVRELSREEAEEELEEAIEGSNEVLITAKTQMTFFPDTITVDRAKVTVTKRTFFSAAELVSIRIEDVLSVHATVGPYFGMVKIVSRVLSADKPYTVGRLKRDDAKKIKRILHGYVIALQRNIDCSSLPTDELRDMLEKLGEDEHPSLQDA